MNSCARASHHHLHVQFFLLQAAHQFRGFVSRHSTGHTERYFHRITAGLGLSPLLFLVFGILI